MMNTKTVYFVDDDKNTLDLIKHILEKEKYTVKAFVNPEELLEEYKKSPSPVVITDMHMPGLSGEQLAEKLNILEEPPVIIFLTSDDDLKTVVNVMRIGVFDYLMKPINKEQLLVRLSMGFEFAELKHLERSIKKEKEIRNNELLEWNRWKHSVLQKSVDKVDGNLISNIKHSLNQGAGVGLMSSLIDIIQESAQYDGETGLINKGLLDGLFQMNDMGKYLMVVLEEIDNIVHSELEMEKLTLEEYRYLVQESVMDAEHYTHIKKHEIKFSANHSMDNKKFISLNRNIMKKVFRELFANAFKFSFPGSKIYIMFEIKSDSLYTYLLNVPNVENGVLGIPESYKNLVFEPFFRISRSVQEDYCTLDYGLGLCFVEKAIHKMRGDVRVTGLKNFIDPNSADLVGMILEMPLV